MSEKTFTAAEVAEILELISGAMQKGCDAFTSVMRAVPEYSASKDVYGWLQALTTENTKQIDTLAEMLRNGGKE
jgi:hypothetical protein